MRVAVIPARGASRRVPRKNVRMFHGKPMLSYPIETAQASGLFDLIVVSTDDEEIAAVAFKCGAVVLPRAFDDGSTGTQEIAARVLEQLGIADGEACVIYATSPLLGVDQLRAGWAHMGRYGGPPFAMSVGPDGQDAGAFYWGPVRAFRERLPLEANASRVPLPAERCCDINFPADWDRAERMYEELKTQEKND